MPISRRELKDGWYYFTPEKKNPFFAKKRASGGFEKGTYHPPDYILQLTTPKKSATKKAKTSKVSQTCGIVDKWDMRSTFASRHNLQCFLTHFFGFHEILFFYFILTQSTENNVLNAKSKCDDIEECMQEATQNYQDFFMRRIPDLVETIHEEHLESFKQMLMNIIELGNLYGMDIGRSPIEETSNYISEIDEDSFLNLTTLEVVKYVNESLLEYVEKKDKEYGIAVSCDVSVSDIDYMDKNSKRSKSPSLYNLGNKDQCPPMHRKVDDPTFSKRIKDMNKGYVFSTNTGCCRYNPKMQVRAGLTKAIGAKLIANTQGEERFDWEKAADHIYDMKQDAVKSIEEITAEIERVTNEKVKGKHADIQKAARIDELESMKKQLLHNMHFMDGQKEYWQVAEEEFAAYRASMLANENLEGKDSFVNNLRISILYHVKIVLAKYFMTSNEQQKQMIHNPILKNLRWMRDVVIKGLIYMLMHPRFSMFIMQAITHAKEDWCRQISIEQRKVTAGSLFTIVGEKFQVYEWMQTSILAILSDPARSRELAKQCCTIVDMVATQFGFPFVGIIAQISVMAFVPAVTEAIQATVWGKIYKDGFDKLIKLFDFSECGKKLVSVGISDLTDDEKFDWAQKILSAMTFSTLQLVYDEDEILPFEEVQFGRMAIDIVRKNKRFEEEFLNSAVKEQWVKRIKLDLNKVPCEHYKNRFSKEWRDVAERVLTSVNEDYNFHCYREPEDPEQDEGL